MAIQWKLYEDAALTTPFSGVLSFVHFSDLSDNPQDRVLYLGNIDGDPADNGAFRLIRRDNTNIVLTITDTTPGAGHETSEISLALSAAGLDTAAPGTPLELGLELLSGASNSVAIHIRVQNAVTLAGQSIELGMSINETVRRSVV